MIISQAIYTELKRSPKHENLTLYKLTKNTQIQG